MRECFALTFAAISMLAFCGARFVEVSSLYHRKR